MNVNNTFLAVLLSVLGLFLAVTSLRLSSVIQGNSVCAQSNTLQNANRGILVVGIVLFMSSFGYLLCKSNCSGNLSSSSTSSDNMMYMVFNLMLGIVVIVLFSIVSSELNKCNASVSKTDSSMVMGGLIIGVAVTVLSLGLMGKKLYDNREQASIAMSQMKINALARAQNLSNKLTASSPDRSSYVDPFGLDLPSSRADNRVAYRDPFGYDDE